MKEILKKLGELSKEAQKEIVLKFKELKESKDVIGLFSNYGINVTLDEAKKFFEMSKKMLTSNLLESVGGGIKLDEPVYEKCELPFLALFDKCEQPIPTPDGPPAPACHTTISKQLIRGGCEEPIA